MALSPKNKEIIYHLQGDLATVHRPFALLAEQVGLTEDEVIDRIRALKESGVIRRFGATLYHQRSGYPANVMVAWPVPQERMDEVGEIMAGFRQVTHCYQRPQAPDWPYDLYTMVHGADWDECRATVEEMSRAAGLTGQRLLFSKKELKKTTMRYFA